MSMNCDKFANNVINFTRIEDVYDRNDASKRDRNLKEIDQNAEKSNQ